VRPYLIRFRAAM